MRRPHFVAAQSRHPTGWLGRMIGWLMVRETAEANDAVLAVLALADGDRLLDVGCGPGRAVERAARILGRGHVTGVDVSHEMLRLATRRCRSLIDSGMVELRRADARVLPYPDAAFDKALSVHTLYFWSEPHVVLREIHRVLVPGGRLAIGFRSKHDERFIADFPASVYRFYAVADVVRLLGGAGFTHVAAPGADEASPLSVVTAVR